MAKQKPTLQDAAPMKPLPSPARIPIATPRSLAVPHTDDLWQAAHDALQAALEYGSAVVDKLPPQDARIPVLNSILDNISAELTALNQEDIHNRTISLQAAAQQLGAGIDQLKALQQKLNQIASNIATTAEIISKVASAISGLQAFLGSFPKV